MKLELANIPARKITIALVILGIGLLLALIVGFLLPQPAALPAVAATEPQDGGENFLGIEPIMIAFKDGLNKKQQDAVYLELQPEAFFTLNWLSDKQVKITLTKSLNLATTYNAKVLYNNNPIHTFSFKTPNITKEQLEQDLAEQAEGDELFAEAQKDWYKENPWYARLPIVQQDYTIVYETSTKKFRIRITLGENPLGAEIQAAKNHALKDLESAGVNLETYGYYFLLDYE